MGRLKGKVAIVTGGSSGIGEATVRLFVAEGAKVVVADIEDTRGMRLAQGLDSAVFMHTDVSKEPEVRNLVVDSVERWGQLDIMFNNAGIAGAVGPIEKITVEEFDRTVGVHLKGVFLGIKHAATAMRQQGYGSIINTASTAGFLAGYGNHIYGACKAGIIQLTRSSSTELGEIGIRVNCISPGFVPTPIIGIARGLSREKAEKKIRIIEDTFREVQPLLGPICPKDIASAALFLASDESRYVNGHNLVVDGGVTSGRMWRDYQKAINSLKDALEDH